MSEFTTKYRGLKIEPKLDFGKHGNKNDDGTWKGYVVTDGLCNIMPAACWFKSIDSAKHGIDCLFTAGGPPHTWDKNSDGKTTGLTRNIYYDNDMFWSLVRQERPGMHPIEAKVREKMDEAMTKAIDNLARYKFSNFGYWSSEWVKLNSLLPKKEPNPFKDLVLKAREMKVLDNRI